MSTPTPPAYTPTSHAVNSLPSPLSASLSKAERKALFHVELDPNEIAHYGDFVAHQYVPLGGSPSAAGELYDYIPANGIIHPVALPRSTWSDLRPQWYTVWAGKSVGVTHKIQDALNATDNIAGQHFKSFPRQSQAINRFQQEYKSGNVSVKSPFQERPAKAIVVFHSTVGNAIACAVSAIAGALLLSLYAMYCK